MLPSRVVARICTGRVGWGRLLRRFCAADRGNLAVIFALSLAPLATAAGVAVDLNRAFVAQQRLERALDAAGLAVGAAPLGSAGEMLAVAQAYFDANYDETAIGVPGELHLDAGDGTITLSATARLPTTLLSVIGIDKLDVASEIEVRRETTALELAMVLDNTGSMSRSGKIGALRDAATDLVNILFGDQEAPELLRVGLVPFVTAVNIRAPSFDMSWMDVNGASRFHGENFDPEMGPTNHFELFETIRNAEWKGCVEMRPEPHDTLDTVPDPSDPDTLFVPYFWPDEPNGFSGYSNNYANDRIDGSAEERQRNGGKYVDRNVSVDETPSTTGGPNKSCPRPLVPLTNDKGLLLDEIAAMRPWFNSGTNIATGLAWGWRVLSPEAPFTEGASYDDEETQKALILLTDGNNEIVPQRGHNGSDYTGFGYVATGRLGTTDLSGARDIVDAKVVELCERVKTQGVRVYSITFQLSSPSLAEVFRNCATEPELYFDSPSNAELRKAFQAIAYDLSNLRLAR